MNVDAASRCVGNRETVGVSPVLPSRRLASSTQVRSSPQGRFFQGGALVFFADGSRGSSYEAPLCNSLMRRRRILFVVGAAFSAARMRILLVHE